MGKNWSDEKKQSCSDRLRRVWPGQRYGKWTVIEGNERRSYDNVLLHRCRCDCGTEVYIPGSRLLTNRTTMCKKCSLKLPVPAGMKRFRDLTGLKFGKWLVVKRIDSKKNSKTALYLCRCECGNELNIPGYPLVNGKSKSCKSCRDRSGSKGPTWNGYQEIPGKWFSKTIQNAKRRGIEYNLTREFVWDLFISQGRKCALSGVDIHFGNVSKAGECTASLDRIDSTKPYTEDNVQFVHPIVNVIKMDLPQSELIHWATLIANHNRNS